MTGLDLPRLRRMAVGWPGSTHWSDCYYTHETCAIRALVREVEGLRELLADADVLAIRWGAAEVRRLQDGIREHEHNGRVHYAPDEHDAWDLDLWSLLDTGEPT